MTLLLINNKPFMIYKIITIIILLCINNVNTSYSRYYDDYNYDLDYEQENTEEQDRYNDNEIYYEDLYYSNYKKSYKNWDTCYIKWTLEKGCYFNWTCYKNPLYSSCVIDKYNAWKCDKWYKEKNGICVENIKTNTNCNIKWNVSFETGEKIYHLPWCEYYASTIIDTNYWERYFCSEEEAIKAWWRKASNCGMVTPITLPPSIKTTDFNTSNYTPTKKEDSDFSWIFYVLIVMGILYFFNKNN